MKVQSDSISTIYKNKRILIVHFRVGRSDGVSIEIDSWKEIFEREGAVVALCSGPENIGANYVLDDLEYASNPSMYEFDRRSYLSNLTDRENRQFKRDFLKKQKAISCKFEKVITDFNPTNIIISNVFSVGFGLPIAGAITNILDRYSIPTILVNHDYYWEESRRREVSNPFIQKQLKDFFPINREYITNLSISSIAKQELEELKGIKSDVLYDTFNYSQKSWKEKKHIR